jgi:hypothetical protein
VKILKMSISDAELFTQILHKHVKNEDLLTPLFSVESCNVSESSDRAPDEEPKKVDFPRKNSTARYLGRIFSPVAGGAKSQLWG